MMASILCLLFLFPFVSIFGDMLSEYLTDGSIRWDQSSLPFICFGLLCFTCRFWIQHWSMMVHRVSYSMGSSAREEDETRESQLKGSLGVFASVGAIAIFFMIASLVTKEESTNNDAITTICSAGVTATIILIDIAICLINLRIVDARIGAHEGKYPTGKRRCYSTDYI